MYEMPPILQGNEQQQIAALRDYLVRMVRSSNAETTQAVQAAVQAATQTTPQGAPKQSTEVKDLQDNAEQLRQLILKTADEVTNVSEHADEIDATLESAYVAKSDFGVYQEQAALDMIASAKDVIEHYELSENVYLLDTIDDLGDQVGDLRVYTTMLDGQIRRGWIQDPITHETAFGIAISQKMTFAVDPVTGQEITHDDGTGTKYYELAANQTVGMYTSTGWQFWIDGQKRGWFDSEDGMLHVINIVSENSFKLSAGWEMNRFFAALEKLRYL